MLAHRAPPQSDPSSSPSCVLTLSLVLVLFAGCGREPAAPAATVQAPAPSTHVGQRVCAECHQKESALWQGSDHQRAMQSADLALGDFKKASLVYNGITSTFFTDNNRLMARTDGPDGRLHDYPIAYTFGVTPLQQYLVAFPGGRYQALSVAWDTRPKAAGGQRWFHLYPARRWITATCCIGPAPRRTGISCARTATRRTCRSDTTRHPTHFDTTWSEINVSCEACHGPGSRHVEWARRAKAAGRSGDALKGLVFSMKDTSRRALGAAGRRGHRAANRAPVVAARSRDVRPLPCQGRAPVAHVRARTTVGRHAPHRAARRRPVRSRRPDPR